MSQASSSLLTVGEIASQSASLTGSPSKNYGSILGCLEKWTDQGVLLLNAVLTVECNQAGSHANRGWERFTDRVIDTINRTRTGVVFLLWVGIHVATFRFRILSH